MPVVIITGIKLGWRQAGIPLEPCKICAWQYKYNTAKNAVTQTAGVAKDGIGQKGPVVTTAKIVTGRSQVDTNASRVIQLVCG